MVTRRHKLLKARGPVEPRLNLTQVAAAIGKSRKTINSWRADGMPVDAGGKTTVAAARAWREARDRALLVDRQAAGDPRERKWRARYRRAKALAAEHALAVRRGQFVPRERLVELLTLAGAETRKLFAALPRTMAPLLVGLEARVIEGKLEVEVDRILTELWRWTEAEGRPRVKRGPGRPPTRSETTTVLHEPDGATHGRAARAATDLLRRGATASPNPPRERQDQVPAAPPVRRADPDQNYSAREAVTGKETDR